MNGRFSRVVPALAIAFVLPMPALAALVGEYHFSNNLNDSSGNGNNGTNGGGAVFTTDRVGNANSALLFNGAANSYITVPININPGSMAQLTMTAWIRPDRFDTPPRHTIISHDDGGFDREITIDDRGGSTGVSAFTGSGVLGGVPIGAGEWMFVAAVYDGSTVKLYGNGIMLSATATNGAGNSYVIIGQHSSGWGEPFYGAIDEVKIFNTALSDTEIAALYAEFRATDPESVPTLQPAGLVLLMGLAALVAFEALRRRRTA